MLTLIIRSCLSEQCNSLPARGFEPTPPLSLANLCIMCHHGASVTRHSTL